MKCVYPEGATPINADEIAGLIPSHISTQAELNEFEQANITRAQIWAFERKHKDLLSVQFIRLLHKKMFGEVWEWAGEFRRTNKNLGVDSTEIAAEVFKLYDDAKYWLEHQTYVLDELAVRFHHRLVSIHPFVNGNGRHARLMTDILLKTHNRPKFTWGSASLTNPGMARERYIKGLKEADAKNIGPLLRFARS